MFDIGCAALPQLRAQLWLIGAEAAFYVDEGCVRPMDAQGADPGTAMQRRIEQRLLMQDYDRPFTAVPRGPVSIGRSDLNYIGALAAEAGAAERLQIALYAPDETLLSLAERALEKAGCSVRAEWEEEMMTLAPGETGVWLTDGGENMCLADEHGCLTESQGQLMRVWAALELGVRPVVAPMNATRASEELAARYGAEIARVSGERPALMRELLESDRRAFRLWFDGIYAALVCARLLAKYSLSPSEWAKLMPAMARSARSVPLNEKDRSRILHELIEGEEEPDMTDGLCVRRGGGWTLIKPSPGRAECRIMAEAADSETADELCAFYEARIRDLLKNKE
ncbi:MAG: hypothetical protein IK080_11700 [Clostridia bacterium]|nr:hypothetical protein [Clostridia bacterium]